MLVLYAIAWIMAWPLLAAVWMPWAIANALWRKEEE